MIDYWTYLRMMAGIYPDADLLPMTPEEVEGEILTFQDSSNLVENGIKSFYDNSSDFTKTLITLFSMNNTVLMKEVNSYLQSTDDDKIDDTIYAVKKNIIATNHAICTYDISPRVNSLSIYPIEVSLVNTSLEGAIYILIYILMKFVTLYTKEDQEIIEIISALIFLFRNIQTNELKYKKCIDISTSDDPNRIIDALSSDWNDYSDFKFKKIDQNTLDRIRDCNTVMNSSLYKSIMKINKDAAYKSDTIKTWERYIDYLNQTRRIQDTAFDAILSDTTKYEKKRIIQQYMDFIENDSNTYKGTSYDIEGMINSVSEILEDLDEYSYARSSKDNNVIPINKDTYLLPRRTTSKDVIIFYHAYRLNLLTAEELIDCFFETFDCLFSPLLEKEYSIDDTASISEKITYIATLVTEYYKRYKKYLPRSQSKHILPPINFVKYSSSWKYTNELCILYYLMIATNLSTKHSNKLFSNSSSLGFRNFYYSKKDDDLKFRFRKEFKQYFDIHKKLNKSFRYNKRIEFERASILLASSHYIYLFINILKQINDDDSLDIPNLESTINSLIKIGDSIDSRGYFSNELNAFRKKYGIDTVDIELRESQKDYNSLVMRIRSELSSASSIETLLKLQSEIDQIWHELPKAERELYGTSFYEDTKSVQNAIYDKCKSEEPDSFANVTLQIKDNLGTKYNHLTENVLKPLSTAEFLYNNYVVSRKIEDFDYSGISALYYQSLEALFNEIIWKPYAEKLNHLNTNRNGSFYQIYSSDEDIPKEYIGYLPKYNRSYYIDSKNKQITTHLNPGSCYHIINDAYNNKHLTHWNHHLLETFGLKEVTVDFINAIYDIANKMSTYDNRNQASHGGNTIDADQCYLDKAIVYSSDGTSTGIINKILKLFIE